MLCNSCVLPVDMWVGSFFAPILPTYRQRTFPQVFARIFSVFSNISRSYFGFTTTFTLLTTKTIICSLILIILIRAEE